MCTCVSGNKSAGSSRDTDNAPLVAENGGSNGVGGEDKNKLLKIAVLGSSGVGKTTMCWKFAYGSAAMTRTDGTEMSFFGRRAANVDEQACTLQIQDVSAQFPVKHSPGNFHAAVRAADGYVVVYAVTERRSLLVAEQLIQYLHHVRHASDVPIVLVGHKADVTSGRRVRLDEGTQLAFEMGVSFYEASSFATPHSLTGVFHDLVRQIRCVRLRKEFEKQRNGASVLGGFSGARGLIDRISLRTKNRRSIMK